MSRPPLVLADTICASGAHCGACRDRDGGRGTRHGWTRFYALPGDSLDFACPRGHPWGYQPPPPPPRESTAATPTGGCDCGGPADWD